MSYSFSVKAATKAEAKLLIAAEFDKVVQHQPVHAKDREAAQSAAFAFTDMLADDDTMDVFVVVNGYLSWSGILGTANDAAFTGANLSIGARFAERDAA